MSTKMTLPALASIPWSAVLRAIGVLVLLALARFFYRLYQVRTMVRRVAREHGVPMPPHSLLWGHLAWVGTLMGSEQSDMAAQALPTLLLERKSELASAGLIYFDLWPAVAPQIFCWRPDMIAQFTQDQSLLKASSVRNGVDPLTGGHDLVVMEGQEWKTWRSIFNPGFSARNLLALVPSMIEEVLVFRSMLFKAAETGEVLSLCKPATALTIDVIGRATLGTRLQVQSTSNPLAQALFAQIQHMVFVKFESQLLNPLRPFRIWYYDRAMKKALLPHIERAIVEAGKAEGPKTILNLAVKSYNTEVAPKGGGASSSRGTLSQVDPGFLDMVVSHLKMFLFAGHETTANALSYAYYLLNTNPATLAAVRAEHDAVLGPDASQAAAVLSDNPTLLNQLPYTAAVVRETLRLFPPVGTVRQGRADFEIRDPDTGRRYPTAGFDIFGCSQGAHRLPEYFPRPHEFVPERWLARDEGDPLHVRRNAWRPFELGPRNCIGQELAMMELRMILALTAREFAIVAAYPADAPRVMGEVAYQTQVGANVTLGPKNGLPVRVTFAKR